MAYGSPVEIKENLWTSLRKILGLIPRHATFCRPNSKIKLATVFSFISVQSSKQS